MKNKLKQLHNTLCLVQTKGESTLIMAECILATRQLIKEVEQSECLKGVECYEGGKDEVS